MRVLIAGAGVTNRMRDRLHAAVSLALASRSDYDSLSAVVTRLHNGEWGVFITDGTNLELVDGELTQRVVRALKEAEREMRDLSPEDRRLLEVIARYHGHGPRRPMALLDIAWAETGTEADGRSALQRLLLLRYIELVPGHGTKELLGKLTDKGADVIAK